MNRQAYNSLMYTHTPHYGNTHKPPGLVFLCLDDITENVVSNVEDLLTLSSSVLAKGIGGSYTHTHTHTHTHKLNLTIFYR